jgi:hypothetical protein
MFLAIYIRYQNEVAALTKPDQRSAAQPGNHRLPAAEARPPRSAGGGANRRARGPLVVPRAAAVAEGR